MTLACGPGTSGRCTRWRGPSSSPAPPCSGFGTGSGCWRPRPRRDRWPPPSPTRAGVVFVPALTGLGAPWWDPYARGTIVGITRGTTRAHLVRAAVEAMAFQTRDVVDAMRAGSGLPVAELRVDGGASAMDVLLQFQADLLGVPVLRAAVQETTALGAAYLAGLATGFWKDQDEIQAQWQLDKGFDPQMDEARRAKLLRGWERAVQRALAWRSPTKKARAQARAGAVSGTRGRPG